MTDSDTDEHGTLSADDAFGALGNETRMEILRALGDADDPLTFSQLREAVGMRDSGQFNYHLDKLVGQFVERTDDGYVLQQAGRRVIEAVLSGAVTQAPEFDLSTIDEQCHYCGAPIAVRYSEERVRMYCTSCEGAYSGRARADGSVVPDEYGYLGTMLLPPAGVEERTPEAAYRAAWTWGNLEILAMASGVCPRCSADVEHTTHICEDHGTADGLCDACGRRHGIHVSAGCTNCNYRIGGGIFVAFGTMTPLLCFLLDHGINPIAPGPDDRHTVNRVHEDYTEEVLDTEPLELRFTTTVDEDEFVLTTDGDLNVIEVDY